MTLSDQDRTVLELAALPGQQYQAQVRDRLGVDQTRFHQMLNRVIDKPEALMADPVLVNRLRRLRADRAAARRWRRSESVA